MKKIKIEESMYVYHFEAANDGGLGINIYALINGKNVLLIDSGYERHMRMILLDLEIDQLKVTHVVPTHYHPDHIGGIKLLQNPEIYGNENSLETLKLFTSVEEIKHYQPRNIMRDNEVLNFGDFELRFTFAKGHSDCSMLIMINNRYLHVGDLFITTNDGKHVLPYVKWSGVREHIKSLNKIQNSLAKYLLLSHGVIKIDYEDSLEGLEDRRTYLRALLDSDNKVSVEEALKDCKNEFVFSKWRGLVK